MSREVVDRVYGSYEHFPFGEKFQSRILFRRQLNETIVTVQLHTIDEELDDPRRGQAESLNRRGAF